jgi:hypothetical protein
LDLFGRFGIDGFDVSGLVPVAYALFAFAVAVAAGALLRRSLPALAAALVAFVAVRITVAGWIRPHYQTPLNLVQAISPGTGGVDSPILDPRDWTLGDGFADATGNQLSPVAVTILEHKALDAGTDPSTYLHDQGIYRWASYHPAGRFWTFQLVETGVFVGLAAIVLALVIWRIRRRTF